MAREMSLSKETGPLALRRPTGPAVRKMLTWRDVVGMLRRRLWLIITLTAALTLASVALHVVWRIKWPLYTSVALIECKMPEQENPLTGRIQTANRDIIMLQQQNQKIRLESNRFLAEVLQRIPVQKTDWFNQRRGDPEQRMKDFQRSFQAQPQRNSNMVLLSMTLPNRGEAQSILNEILSQFRIDRDEQAGGKLRDRLESIRNSREEVSKKITDKNVLLEKMISDTKEPGFERGESRWWEEYKMMLSDMLILETQIKDGQQIMDYIQNEIDTLGYNSAVQIDVENTHMVTNLRYQITYLYVQLSQLQERFGEGHQKVKELRSSIWVLEDRLRDMRQQLQDEYSLMQKNGLEREVQSKAALLDAVTKRYEAAQSKLEQLVTRQVEYMRTQRERGELMPQQRQLDGLMDGVMIQLNDADRVRVEIPLNSATMPLWFSSPRPWQWFLAGGLFLGLALSLGLVFFLEFIDDSVKTPRDVRRHLNIPLLGMIPFYEGAAGAEAPLAKIAYHHPQSLMSEAYRQLRTNLFFSAPIEEMKSVLVTSSSAGCGKTTTAVNLGITLAAEGKRVLLLDANFHRPALYHMFTTEGQERGLSNILVGQVSATEVIHHTEIEGLDVVDAGPAPPNPAVLLSSMRMKDLLDGQKQYYDHIIIDGPPCLVVTDAHILAGLVDGTIVVVHAGDTSRGVVQRMAEELRNNKVNILGILLNAVRPLKGGYFHESQQLYYDYISPEAAPAALPQGKGGGVRAEE